MKMKKQCMFLLTMALLWLGTFRVFAATVIPTDVTSPSSGCTLLGIEGKYIVQIPEALARINQIRQEACEEGVRNPATGKPLTSSDYVPIKWSSDLEYIARIRAAEASVTMDHVRTNGKSCFALQSPRAVGSYGEVIAWNFGETMVDGINQWYGEKADWVNQTPGAVTGHYTQMIDPRNFYVGLGTFCSETARYYNTTAGEFSSRTGLDETQGIGIASCIQLLEVNNSYLTNLYTVSGSTSGKYGDRTPLRFTTGMRINDYWGNSLATDGLLVMGTISWSSSNAGIASVDASGTLTAHMCGSAQISAKDTAGHTGSLTFEVEHIEVSDPAVPATCTSSGKTDGSHCSICGEVLTAQEDTNALGHKFSRYTSNNDATALQDGTKTAKCHRCGAIDTVTDKGSKLTPTIQVTASSIPLKTKQKLTTFQVSGLAAGDYVKSWESSKPSIVKVEGNTDGSCIIVAKKKTGLAKLTITLASGKTKTVTIKVQKKAVDTTKITNLKKKMTIKKGQKTALKPVISPISSKKKITYSSSNKRIVTVSKAGIIRAKRTGTAKITVRSGSAKATITVKVRQ